MRPKKLKLQPGQSLRNADVERCNRTLHYEWLARCHWRDLGEIREYARQWRWRYNHERPNMALAGIIPKQRLTMAAWLDFPVLGISGEG